MSEYPYENTGSSCAHVHLGQSVAEFFVKAPRHSRILDVGCGNGATLGTLRGRELELRGIDSSESGIRIAKSAYPDVCFRVGDVSGDLGSVYPPNYFDFVICTEVVEHVYNPRGLIRNCFSLLKPAGQLLISTPYHGWLKNTLLAVTGKLDGHFTALWDHGHIKFWSRLTLTVLLQEAGFEDLQFLGVGRIPYAWKSMIFTARKPH
jgi:2-polyprenyl-3-methyl-5-hydroxy-6-metoxy-1,4-benzoquinol methylase